MIGPVFNRLFVALAAIGVTTAWTFVAAGALAAETQVEKNNSVSAPLPVVPKISSFAPAKDLVSQVQVYINELETTLESEEEYKDSEGKVGRCTGTLAVIALCLGMHDEDNKHKADASALIKAAQELAATADYQSAKKAFEVVKAAAEGKTASQSELKWQKVASLTDLMKQVPNINNKLKRNIKGAKFKSKAKDTAGYTAAIAAIAQGSMADISKAKTTDEAKKWYEFSIQMRDSAGAANAAIRAGNEPAAAEAMKKLAQSCEDCHKVFHPEALLIEETDSE